MPDRHPGGPPSPPAPPGGAPEPPSRPSILPGIVSFVVFLAVYLLVRIAWSRTVHLQPAWVDFTARAVASIGAGLLVERLARGSIRRALAPDR